MKSHSRYKKEKIKTRHKLSRENHKEQAAAHQRDAYAISY